MRAGIALVLAALSFPAGGMFELGAAKVVRGTTMTSTNPAVEAGGHRVSKTSPDVPYSLVGAIATSDGWFSECLGWPWRVLNGFSGHHRAAGQPVPPLVAPSRR